MPNYEVYVGIDWATRSHQVCITDAGGQRLGESTVAHSGTGLDEFVAELTRHGPDPTRIAVALEVPRGAIVDTLLERGFHVFALNPKQLDRFRDRHTVAGAKDDRRDALVAADSLRTDQHCFRRVRPEHPDVIRLRELSRTEETLGIDLRRCVNQLSQLL